jgi:DNA-binding beta-propeller fold protein YncE
MRHHHVVGSLAAGILLIATATVFVWAWMQPVRLRVTITPPDATVRIDDGREASGRIDVTGVEPGPHFITMSRKGFETRVFVVQAKRLTGCVESFALKPLPQQVKVRVVPDEARIRVLRGDRVLADGSGTVSAELPAGPVVIEVSSKGFNTQSEEVYLDELLDRVVRLDPKGQLVNTLAVSECAGAPNAVALRPDESEAWATILDGPPSIEIFDPGAGRCIGTIDLGEHGADQIVFDTTGTHAYVSQSASARIFEIDVRQRKVMRQFVTGGASPEAVALSADGKTLYAANRSGDDVSEIDLVSGKVRRRIDVADEPRGLWPAADGTTLWVASFRTGDLERVDLTTGKVKRVFSSGGSLRHLVADEQRGRLYASDMAGDCVWITDMLSGESTRFASVDRKPNAIDLSPNGGVLFVACQGAENPASPYLPGPEWGSVLLLDTSNAEPLDAIVGGNQCTALDMSETRRMLAFSDLLDDRLHFYRVPRYEELAEGNGGRFGVYKAELKKQLAFPEP